MLIKTGVAGGVRSVEMVTVGEVVVGDGMVAVVAAGWVPELGDEIDFWVTGLQFEKALTVGISLVTLLGLRGLGMEA